MVEPAHGVNQPAHGVETPRLVKIFVAALGALLFAPVVFLGVVLLTGQNFPARAFIIGVFAAWMGGAFLWFWFRAHDAWSRGICVVLVTVAAFGASLTPESLHGGYRAGAAGHYCPRLATYLW